MLRERAEDEDDSQSPRSRTRRRGGQGSGRSAHCPNASRHWWRAHCQCQGGRGGTRRSKYRSREVPVSLVALVWLLQRVMSAAGDGEEATGAAALAASHGDAEVDRGASAPAAADGSAAAAAAESVKRPAGGQRGPRNRTLDEESDVFKHNAW